MPAQSLYALLTTPCHPHLKSKILPSHPLKTQRLKHASHPQNTLFKFLAISEKFESIQNYLDLGKVPM
jgi:hypothetical protein